MSVYLWSDIVRHLAIDPVVMRSSPATGHIRCAWLTNQPKQLNLLSWLLTYLSDK